MLGYVKGSLETIDSFYTDYAHVVIRQYHLQGGSSHGITILLLPSFEDYLAFKNVEDFGIVRKNGNKCLLGETTYGHFVLHSYFLSM